MKYIPDPPSPGDFKTRILWPQESLMQGRGGGGGGSGDRDLN